MNENKTVRSITFFDKLTENYVDQYVLSGVKPSFLQELVGENNDNPLYDSWPLDENQMAKLTPYFEGSVDFDRYDYFLDAYVEEAT